MGTKRSYINATRIDCGTLDAANVSANSVSSSSLSGGAQNGLGPQVVDYLATQTSSNSYAIINKPALAQVATSGSYLALANVPNFANVAFTNSYNSLSNLPALSNVALTGSFLSLANVPAFANVAFTNNYNSLSNLPSLSQVAYTGAYANLSGKPTNLSSFTNDLTSFSNGLTVTGNASVSKSLVVTGNITANLISLPNANFSGRYSELQGTPNATYTASSNIGTLVAANVAANTLTLSANVDYPVTITENYSAGANGYSHAVSAINPALSTGEAFNLQVGQSAAQYGSSYLGHVYNGNLYSNNYATIGLFAQDRILNVTGNRQVGINTTNPAYNLDVVGNIHSTGVAYADGGVQTNGCVLINYNPSVYSFLCPGAAQMGYTQFGSTTGYSSCPTLAFVNYGTGTYTPNPANTVTTNLYFKQNAQQASFYGACLQVRDDGQPFYNLNGQGGLSQPSAYIALQTGGADRLVVGNSGVVSVPGTIVTPTLKQTNAYASQYTLTSTQSIPATTTTTLTSWSSPNVMTTVGAPLNLNNGVFTTTHGGVYSIQVHCRFNATASENAVSLYSNGGAVFSSGSRLAVNDGTVYDVCVPYLGYLASGDTFYVGVYCSIANSVNTGSIPTTITVTLITMCT